MLVDEITRAFLRAQSRAVIATTGPEAALILVAVQDDMSVLFETYAIYRKYANIVRDPHVAFVFGLDGDITVQCEGIAQECTDDAAAREVYAAQTASTHLQDERARLFRVQLAWIRYADYGAKPWVVNEYFL